MPADNLDAYKGVPLNRVGSLAVIAPYAEPVTQRPEGVWRDIIINQDGTIREVTPWQHNLVVTSYALLIAQLVMGNGTGTGPNGTYNGYQYMALGTGQSSWDTDGVPNPALTDTALVTEPSSGGFRKLVTAQMVDASNVVTAALSNRVLVSATFSLGEANGSLREWGIFGGNATATAASGIMVDHVTHPLISKPAGGSDFVLVRQVTVIH